MSDGVDWEDVIMPVLVRTWEIIHVRLVKFRDRLDKWLNGLLAGPISANWREELASFVEQTRADGLVIKPDGIAALEGIIQGRVDANARQKGREMAMLAAPAANRSRRPVGAVAASNRSPGRTAGGTGETFFNGAGERQKVVRVANLQERQVNGKTWVYFQKEADGPWYGVLKKPYFLHDAAGNLLNDQVGVPRSARDLTGAKPVDWATSITLNHPADAGWAKIAKQYGELLPVSPEELREDMSKSSEVTGPLARYTGKTIAIGVIAGAIGKGLGKAAEALLGGAEKEGVKQAAGKAAKAAEAAKNAEAGLAKEVTAGEAALTKEVTAGEAAVAKEAAEAAKAGEQAQGKIGPEVWDKGPAVRGEIIEKELGQNLSRTFPTIDKFENGLATSIKSMNLAAPTYADAAAITRAGEGYVNKVAAFTGAQWNGIRISQSQIKSRALDLVVPPQATAAQTQALERLVVYGKSKGVTVNIIKFPK